MPLDGSDGDPRNGAAPVRYRVDGPVARLTLTGAVPGNPLTRRALGLLDDALDQALDDPDVGVVLLAADGGDGGGPFCLGTDLAGEPDDEVPDRLAHLLTAFHEATKPVVARVGGDVRGGGNALVSAADVVVAADGVTFGFDEVRYGVTPAVALVGCLRRVRQGDLAAAVLTGEPFDAARAHVIGLVDRVVAPDELDAATGRVLDAVLAGAPAALAVTKQLLRELPGMPEEDALRWAASLADEMAASREAHEGRTASASGEAPSWVRRHDDG